VRRSSARRSDVGMSRGSALRIALRIPVRSVAAILNSRAFDGDHQIWFMWYGTYHFSLCSMYKNHYYIKTHRNINNPLSTDKNMITSPMKLKRAAHPSWRAVLYTYHGITA